MLNSVLAFPGKDEPGMLNNLVKSSQNVLAEEGNFHQRKLKTQLNKIIITIIIIKIIIICRISVILIFTPSLL